MVVHLYFWPNETELNRGISLFLSDKYGDTQPNQNYIDSLWNNDFYQIAIFMWNGQIIK